MKKFKEILKIIFLSCIIFLSVSLIFKRRLPSEDKIDPLLRLEPLQEVVQKEPFTINHDGVTYEVELLYSYELHGLIVAEYDSENFLDYAHKKSNDRFNTKDLCVIWGTNIRFDDYRQASYSHGEWSCSVIYSPEIAFNVSEISNNHLLPANDKIYRQIKNSDIGDQIYFKGYLAKYKWQSENGYPLERGTSISREDSGDGACEVVYVEEFKTIRKGNPIWHLIFKLSKYVAIVSFLLLFIFWIKREKVDLSKFT